MTEWYTNTADLLSAAGCLVQMVTSVICAAFRWFHMCRPYDEEPSLYYPSRPLVTAFFLCQLLNAPFLLRPSDPVVIAYAASIGMIVTPTFFGLIFLRFFNIGSARA